MTYLIKFKEYGREWSKTSFTSNEPVSKNKLVEFFGLDECEDYEIEVENI